jgi:hypothetical protein
MTMKDLTRKLCFKFLEGELGIIAAEVRRPLPDTNNTGEDLLEIGRRKGLLDALTILGLLA